MKKFSVSLNELGFFCRAAEMSKALQVKVDPKNLQDEDEEEARKLLIFVKVSWSMLR